MRGGGRLLLILGVLIAAVAAGLLFVFLSGRTATPVPGIEGLVTAVPTADPGVDVVVAQGDIPANRVISDTTLLTTRNIKTSDYNANRGQLFTNVSEVVGKLAINAIPNGQQITKRDITDPGLSQQIPTPEDGRPPDKGYPIRVDAQSGVADQIKPGDTVDVVATFKVTRRVAVPAGVTEGEGSNTAPPFENVDFFSTKTIVQQAQVLRIVRPPAPQDGDQAAQQGQPTAAQPEAQPTVAIGPDGQPVQPAGGQQQGNTITGGSWILVVALNDQEAELVEFARVSEAQVSLVLRAAGDRTFDQTIGASLDLLISEFGLPEPQPEPVFVYGREVLTPLPTRTPAPTRVP